MLLQTYCVVMLIVTKNLNITFHLSRLGTKLSDKWASCPILHLLVIAHENPLSRRKGAKKSDVLTSMRIPIESRGLYRLYLLALSPATVT